VRNSSLVEWFCAENVAGLKHITEASAGRDTWVGERSVGAEAVPKGAVDLTEVRMPV
jgi:hypothetical protein